MTTREELAAGGHIALTSYRRSGEEVTRWVRVVPVSDGRVGFRTALGSDEAERLAHTPRVRVQRCDARGRLAEGSTPLDGTAEVVRSGRCFHEVRAGVRRGDGVRSALIRFLAGIGPERRSRGHADAVVLVRVD